MDLQFSSSYSFWLVLLCIAAGILYAFILYRRDSAFNEINIWLRRLMFVFRAFVVALVALFLLSPMIKSTTRQVEKPIVIIAQDNSSSIVMNKDSAFYRNQYTKALQDFSKALASKYEVRTLSWAEKVKEGLDINFREKETDMSGMLDETDNRFLNRNVGAVIIASDGIYNKGANPLYREGLLKVPYYTIALGDTTVQKDVFISDVRYNKTAYLNSSFPLEIIVQAQQCNGNNVTLKVNEDNSELFTKTIAVNNNRFMQKVPVYLEAKTKGIHHYKVALSAVAGELTPANNTRDVFVEVADKKEKILLLASVSHPDIGAIEHAIESNENYELTSSTIPFTGKWSDYNAVIFYQLPSEDGNGTAETDAAMKQNIPRLFITGGQTNVALFNRLNAGITINGNNKKTNQVIPFAEQNFSLFSLSDDLFSGMNQMPPMYSPFGDYKFSAANSVLLSQRIGSVNSGIPLWTFNETEGVRTAVITGEGFWRWRLYDFKEHGNFTITNELITKTVQYLLVKQNKSRFRIDAQNTYNENEEIVMTAEVFDENFELTDKAEVNIVITNAQKNNYPFAFTNTGKSYSLNAGFFATGEYRYRATAKLGNNTYTVDGAFVVIPVQVEQSETVANHQLLYMLSQKSGGKMFYPTELDKLKDELLNRKDLASVSYTQTKLEELINKKWLFFVILLFLTAEWFIRKRSGTY
jgi:hypothetical protein